MREEYQERLEKLKAFKMGKLKQDKPQLLSFHHEYDENSQSI